MALVNKSTTNVSISGFTYNNVLADLLAAIGDSDEYKDSITDLTESEGAMMICEALCYVAEQLSNRIDLAGNELFVDTASSEGLSRLLKLVGHKLDFPSCASVEATVSTDMSIGDDITFSKGIDTLGGSNNLKPNADSFKAITIGTGSNTSFEFIKYDEDSSSFDYITPVSFHTPSQNIVVYEGKTKYQYHTINSIKKNIITLPNSSVIKNSVEIYYTKKDESNGYAVKKLVKVDNFFSRQALTCTTGYYTVRNLGGGLCEIVLQPAEDDLSKELVIMYRVGGGAVGNISIGDLYTSEQMLFGDADSSRIGVINFSNKASGVGGKDEETPENIRTNVVQEVRNSKIAATEEDYNYLLPKLDSKVGFIQTYGEKNQAATQLAKTYGYYVNPLNVWILILKYNKDIIDDYLGGAPITDYLNDICFQKLDLTPRFNEKYQIKSAYLNKKETYSQLNGDEENQGDYFYDEVTKRYYYKISLTSEEMRPFKKGNSQITLTNVPYVESRTVSKRGVNNFAKYSNPDKTNMWTWENFIKKTSAKLNDVYIIVNKDKDDEIGRRYICIEAFTGTDPLPLEDFLKHWKKVDFDYIYDNLNAYYDADNPLTEDVLWIRQENTVSNFKPLCSKIATSYVCEDQNWKDVVKVTDGQNDKIHLTHDEVLTINGYDILFAANDYSKQNFADLVNISITPYTQMAVLQNNIAPVEGLAPYSASCCSDPAKFAGKDISFTLTFSDSVVFNFSFTSGNIGGEESTDTYGKLINEINSKLAYYGLGERAAAGLFPGEDETNNKCYKLAIISAEDGYVFKESPTDYSVGKGFYSHYLNALESATVVAEITPDETPMDPNLVDDYMDYCYNSPNVDDFAKVVGDKLVLGFTDNHPATTLAATNLNFYYLFGYEPGTTNITMTAYDERVITAVYNNEADEPEAYILISLANKNDKLTNDIYINIFGATVSSIKLGDYYSNLDTYEPELNEKVKSHLTREPLTSLYSVKYITEDDGITEREDIYGSDYTVKFTSQKIGESTFYQINNSDKPATVMLAFDASDNVKYFDENLYLKVDCVDFTTKKTITIEDGTEVEIVPENGYAVIPMGVISTKIGVVLIKAILDVFPDKLQIVSESNGEIGLATISSDYASTLDFGKSSSNLLGYLFGISNNIVTSEEGQINLKKISYKTFPLTSSFVVAQDVLFNLKIKGENSQESYYSDAVSTGYSISDFSNNLKASKINQYTPSTGQTVYKERVLIDGQRIAFKELHNGSEISITLPYDSLEEQIGWRAMFAESDSFINTKKTRVLTASIPYETGVARDRMSEIFASTAARTKTGTLYSDTDVYADFYFDATVEGNEEFVESIFSSSWTEDVANKIIKITIPFENDAQKKIITDNFVKTRPSDPGDTILTIVDTATEKKAILSLKYNSGDYTSKVRQAYINIVTASEHLIVDDTGNLSVTYKNDGDYYIEIGYDESGNKEYTFNLENESVIPLGDIYFHMLEDYSHDHVCGTNGDGTAKFTDEYIWNSILSDKKIMLATNLFKQPRFIPFDLKITCYIPNRVGLNKTEEYKVKIQDYLREVYGVYANNSGETLLADDIVLNIRNNVQDIKRVDVEYLGYSMSNQDTTQGYLDSDFNQKFVLASDVITQTPTVNENLELVIGDTYAHGLQVTVKYLS